MEAMTIARVGGDARPRPETPRDRRRSGRTMMVRAAQIAFGASVLDCALLDASAHGARVHLLALADVPELATLRLPDGESRTVRRRWSADAQIGWEFVGPPLH